MNKNIEKKIQQAKWSFEEEILDIIVKRDEFTTSDLQGIVSALVSKIMIFSMDIMGEKCIKIVKDTRKGKA